jgi:hypothetical protein
MSGGIYLRRGGELIPMSERPYGNEDALQALLAEHPGFLAGDQVGDAPRRWVLLSREVGIADQDGTGAARWSLDHLFVDQDAIPTLVEVKRSSDTRIRREVVGQLLEYAANGTRYWPVEQLREMYERNARSRGLESDEELRETFGEIDVDAWWDDVGANLQLGRLRLVFVADEISRELRRIIEFLNAQMTQTEVLGVEIRQYVDEAGDHQTLVPRLIGQTEAARDVKARPQGREWDETTWLAEVERRHGEAHLGVARRLLDWARERGLTIRFGKGAHVASMQFGLVDGATRIFPFYAYTSGEIELQFGLMVSVPYPPFDQLDYRRELRDRLLEIAGATLPEKRLDKRPSFLTSALQADGAFTHFTATMEWVFDEARSAAPPGS